MSPDDCRLCAVVAVDHRGTDLIFVIMFGTTLSNRWNWQKLFSYGEVACFISAWAVGLLVAMQNQRPTEERATAHTFASASDTLGIQATLRR